MRAAGSGLMFAAREWIPTPPAKWTELKRGDPYNVDVQLHDQQVIDGRRRLRCWHQYGKVEIALHDLDETWAHIPIVGPAELKLRRCECEFLTPEGPMLRFTTSSCIRLRTSDAVSDTAVIELFGGIGGMSSAARVIGASVRALVESEDFTKHLQYPVTVLHQSVTEPRYLSTMPCTRAVKGGAPCQPFTPSSESFGRRSGTQSEEGKLAIWIPLTADMLDSSHFFFEQVTAFAEKVNDAIAVQDLSCVATACGYKLTFGMHDLHQVWPHYRKRLIGYGSRGSDVHCPQIRGRGRRLQEL